MTRKRAEDDIDAVLQPLGFVRHGSIWNRREREFIDVVELERERSPRGHAHLHLGVLHVEVHAKCWDESSPNVVDESICTVRGDNGDLVFDGSPLTSWIGLDGDADAFFGGLALPFFHGMHSLEGLRDFLTKTGAPNRRHPSESLYLAIIEFELGNVSAALELLEKAGQRANETWRKQIAEVFARLELP